MEKIKKEVKVRLLALFILSNLSTLMIGTYLGEAPIDNQIGTEVLQRENYVPLKLKVVVGTSLDVYSPLVLTNKSRKLYIPYVFFVEERSNDLNPIDPFDEAKNTKEIILSVPTKYVSQLIAAKGLLLVPQIARDLLVTTQPKHGEKYEISF